MRPKYVRNNNKRASSGFQKLVDILFRSKLLWITHHDSSCLAIGVLAPLALLPADAPVDFLEKKQALYVHEESAEVKLDSLQSFLLLTAYILRLE